MALEIKIMDVTGFCVSESCLDKINGDLLKLETLECIALCGID